MSCVGIIFMMGKGLVERKSEDSFVGAEDGGQGEESTAGQNLSVCCDQVALEFPSHSCF